jgi:hypothetical protein
MPQVTVRLFSGLAQTIGEEHLKPLLKTLPSHVAYALSVAEEGIHGHVKPESIDVIVIKSGPLDVSVHDLVITIEAEDQPGARLTDTVERARHVLQQVGYSFEESKYPRRSILTYRVDVKLGFTVSAATVS